jgi:hypothetical protein
MKKLSKIAVPAILLLAVSNASWAASGEPCDNPGAYNCVFGRVHVEAAPNGGFKFNVQQATGAPVEFCMQYSLTDVQNQIGKTALLTEGAARAVLYTGAGSSCSGAGFSADGPIR